jgi:putative ABC transport system ATP-binding protein
MALAKLTNVHKSYESGGETTKVLIDLDLQLEKGEMVMVMGPSGSGKTTLLNILGGIDKATKGKVEISGADLMSLGPKGLGAFRRAKVGFIFQFYNLIPTLTAIENIELGLETVWKDKRDIRSQAKKYLDLVGLKDKTQRFPQELSGGEQQRVAIARALAKEPAIILADEPTGNLDESREQKIMQLMKKLQHEMKMTFLIVSHNTRLKQYMDRTFVLRKGGLTQEKS